MTITGIEYNADWIGDGLQYQDPEGTFEGIEDLEIMEVYDTHNIASKSTTLLAKS